MLDSVKESVLPNGLKLITYERTDVESVSFGLYCGVGSRYESNDIRGMSHFVEHMLFKGTKNRSQKQITQFIEGNGGYMNAATSHDGTYYYAVVPYDRFTAVLDVFCDMYFNPKFDPKELEKERMVVLEEMKSGNDDPMNVAMELSTQALWKNHPIGLPIIGTEESLFGINRDSMMQFHDNFYVSNNTFIVAVGRIVHEKLYEHLCNLLSDKNPLKNLHKPKSVTSKTPMSSLIYQEKKIEQVNAVLSFRTNISFTHDDIYTLNILNAILGGSMSSRLFQNLREKNGLAYAISSSVNVYKETGALHIFLGTDSKKCAKAFSICAKDCMNIVKGSVTKKELKRVLDYIIGIRRISTESTLSQLSWISRQRKYTDEYMSPSKLIELYKKVSLDNITDVANTIFKPENCSISLVYPEKSLDPKSILDLTKSELSL